MLDLSYQNLRMPPPLERERGVAITSLKDIFHLLDKYPEKRPYSINWSRLFREKDWVWVSPRVFKDLQYEKKLGVSFRQWDANFARNLSKRTKKTEPDWDFFPTKKKFGKLTETPSTNVIATLVMPRLISRRVSIPVTENVGENLATVERGMASIFRKLQKTDLRDISDMYSLPLKASINLIESPEQWVVNYDNGVIEINTTKLLGLSLEKRMALVLEGVGLAFLPLVLRTKMKTWFRFFQRNRFPVRPRWIHKSITKPHYAFALALRDYAFGENTFASEAFELFHGIQKRGFIPNVSLSSEHDVDSLPLPLEVIGSLSSAVIEAQETFEGTPLDGVLNRGAIVDLMGISALGGGDALSLVHPSNVFVSMDNSFRDILATTLLTESGLGEESWLDVGGEGLVEISRTLWYNKVTGASALENDFFVLEERHRGKGVGLAMMEKQLAFCLQNDIGAITCMAARSGDYIGYKVWHKMGYDGQINIDRLAMSAREDFLSWCQKSVELKISQYPLSAIIPELRELVQHFSMTPNLLPVGFQNGKPLEDITKRELLGYIQQLFREYQNVGGNLHLFVELSDPPQLEILSLATESIQNLMDLEGFEDWWAENGVGWKATLDLSDGVESEAFMIFSLYQKKKGLLKLGSGSVLTKSMGDMSLEDLTLFDRARKEIRNSKRIALKVSSRWLE